MSNEQVDLNILRKVKHRKFLQELDASIECLTAHQATHYFKILLSHFLKDLDTTTGNAILLALSKVIATEEFTKTFVSGHFELALPYSQPQYAASILNLLYLLAQQAPDTFDEDFVAQFVKLIPLEPRKSLLIIAVYLHDYAELSNPWPMTDLIFQKSKYFISPAFANEYISLLAYLVRRYSDFRKARANHCWNNIIDMLQYKEIDAINSCYYGLAAIGDGMKKITLPIEIMTRHLKYEELHESILSLLLVVPKSAKLITDVKFIVAMLRVAKHNIKATLILIEMASFKQISQLIIKKSAWLQWNLPTLVDTMRLFYMLLSHKSLRPEIAEMPDLIDFLKRSVTGGKSTNLVLISTILRRLPLNKEFVVELSRSEFLKDFLAEVEKADSLTADQTALLLVDTIAPYAYVPEYLLICESCSREIVSEREFSKIACQVAFKLCKYQKCVERLLKKRLGIYFKNHANEPDHQDDAETFFSLIGIPINDHSYYSSESNSSDSDSYESD